MFKINKKLNTEKGISLYIAIMILAVLLAISLGLSSILVAQLKMISGMENSVTAFFAADTGIERELKDRNYENPYVVLPNNSVACSQLPCSYSEIINLDPQDGTLWPTDGICPNALPAGPHACYKIVISQISPQYKIQSLGVFRKTRRAIEVRF